LPKKLVIGIGPLFVVVVDVVVLSGVRIVCKKLAVSVVYEVTVIAIVGNGIDAVVEKAPAEFKKGEIALVDVNVIVEVPKSVKVVTERIEIEEAVARAVF